MNGVAESIGAAIVNYNSGDHLDACVVSLLAEGIERIVVVDNGSTDESIAHLKQAHPEVKVVLLPHNPGFGTAMNSGVAEVDLPLVFCLNPDTVIQPGVVEVMKTEMENASAIAVAGPRLVEADGSVYPSARNFPSLVDGAGHALVGLVWPNNRWTQRYKRTGLHREEATDVDWLSGAALFVRRTAFKEVGGFDERYFMYMEDVDLCWRLIRAGWRIRYVPSVTVIHFRGVSTDQHPYRFIVAHHKSLFRYHLRTSRGVDRLALPVVTAGLVLRTPVACLHRWLIGKRADHKSLRPRRAQGAGKVSR